MTKHLSVLCFIAVIVMAPAAFAGDSIDRATRVTVPTAIPIGGPSLVSPRSTSPTCPVLYDALVPTGTSFLALSAVSPVSGGPYTEYADDIHIDIGGLLCEFSFTYFEPAPGPTDMIVTIYANDAGDATIGPIVAGPYLLAGLPGGLTTVTVPVPDTPLIPEDVWFSITGTTLSHGLVIAGGPPTTGVSHDVFLDVPGLGLVFFGGSPVANFNISLDVDVTVPTEETTWGQIKSMYE